MHISFRFGIDFIGARDNPLLIDDYEILKLAPCVSKHGLDALDVVSARLLSENHLITR